MRTRAKFLCKSIEPNAGSWAIKLDPVIGGSPENREFFQYTPGGNIYLAVVGSDTASQFKVGYEYYVDFTQVEE